MTHTVQTTHLAQHMQRGDSQSQLHPHLKLFTRDGFHFWPTGQSLSLQSSFGPQEATAFKQLHQTEGDMLCLYDDPITETYIPIILCKATLEALTGVEVTTRKATITDDTEIFEQFFFDGKEDIDHYSHQTHLRNQRQTRMRLTLLFSESALIENTVDVPRFDILTLKNGTFEPSGQAIGFEDTETRRREFEDLLWSTTPFSLSSLHAMAQEVDLHHPDGELLLVAVHPTEHIPHRKHPHLSASIQIRKQDLQEVLPFPLPF